MKAITNFGIMAAVAVAKRGQQRAIAKLSKNKMIGKGLRGKTEYAKIIIDILARPSSDARFQKGYILLTSNQIKYANGMITDAQIDSKEFDTKKLYQGSRMICGIDVNVLNGRVCIVPIR